MTVIRVMRSGEYALNETVSVAASVEPRGHSASSDHPWPDGILSQAELFLFKRLGIGKPTIARAAKLAAAHGTTVEQELLHACGIDEPAYYEALAREVGLPFCPNIPATEVVDIDNLDTQLVTPRCVRISQSQHAPVTAIVPEAHRIDYLKERLRCLPALVDMLVITTPSALRQAVWQAGSRRRVTAAVSDLFDRKPELSARIVVTGQQGFWLGTCLTATVSSAIIAWEQLLLVLHLAFSCLYMSTLCLRMASLGQAMKVPAPPPLPIGGALPTYTVMVALYREAAVVSQLVQSLDRLDWPRSCLDIKLVCEADDSETIEALKALRLGPQYEIVTTPDFGPRTKPKALSYALRAARGRYIVVYDAEDRPHASQLKEAHARFSSLPGDVACLQAPLIISNANKSFISAIFALEYAAQFRGFLPFLARYRLPIPLGGTSNHFRTEVLQSIGGWDPFNVTEDADLGMRLHRSGYRTGVLRAHTLEDAPVALSVWMRQRSRWFKGWFQTWLVMTRDAKAAIADMGWRGYCVLQLLFGGVIISALLHPVIAVAVVQSCVAMSGTPAPAISVTQIFLLVIDIFNVAGAYAGFIVLGLSPMIREEKKLVGYKWVAVGLYWLMITVAAWRALFELRRNPFHWHKTPHVPVVV